MFKFKKICMTSLIACAMLCMAACGGRTKEDETKNTTTNNGTNQSTTTRDNATTRNDEIDTNNTNESTTRQTGIIDEIGSDVERGVRDIADGIKR